MLNQLVLDPVIGQGSGGIEAEGAKIAGQHLHRCDTAGLDGSDEFGPGGKREILAAPQAETLGIGEIVDGSSACRRDVDDSSAGEGVLEPQAGTALLRRRNIASFSLSAAGVLHGMALVEDDYPVEIGAQPIDDLADARNLVGLLIGPQRGIGGE